MASENPYSKTTHSVKVTVMPIYLDGQSDPDDNHFLWAYHVRIENMSEETIQLRTRHWRIIDGFGRLHEVQGGGVVGEQPIMKPGETFEYTSGAPLSTPSGIMAGSYGMETEDGQMFEVEIPPFSLDSPYQPVSIN